VPDSAEGETLRAQLDGSLLLSFPFGLNGEGADAIGGMAIALFPRFLPLSGPHDDWNSRVIRAL
jgi:hypothetical protein